MIATIRLTLWIKKIKSMPNTKETKMSLEQGDEKKTEESPDEQRKRERDLFLNQILYLTEELEGYQLKCDDLEQQKKDFMSQYSSLETDKKDIVEYLKHSLLEKEDEVDELSARLESQRQAAEKDRDALQLQHAQMSQELQERIEELSGENRMLETSLASLEEFRRQREQLTSNMESLEKQLSHQEEEHTAGLHSMEMSVLLEKQRLEKEMERHMAKMAADVQRLVDQEVPEVTKRAFEENTELRTRCNKLSDQAEILIKENSALQLHKKKLKSDLSNLEEMLKELSLKISVHKKVVKQETEKCEQLQAELNVCRQEQQQLQGEHKRVLVDMEALRQKQASLPEPSSGQSAEVRRLEAELQEEKRKSGRMKRVIQEAVDTLRQTLMEALEEQETPEKQEAVEEQETPEKQEAPEKQHSEAGVDRWTQLMQKLLVVLDTRKLAGSSAEDLTSDPAATSSVILDPVSSYHFQLARYTPGDLGLIPPMAQKPLRFRTRPGSIPSLLRKPSGPKTTSSLNLSGSAGRLMASKHVNKKK
ncbi:cilia- and flagella-associated protein 157 isoform X2 [Paralichthys olivaceus]|uniref:cilia- and flagella-associated protein 157 isoform X2 n=1 Tax=Paralichthys olivaceus TaxID=8255 RepID=UPI003753DA92